MPTDKYGRPILPATDSSTKGFRRLIHERNAAVDALRLVRDWLEPGVSDTSEHDTYTAIDDSVAHINSVLADMNEGGDNG